jgi:2-polyprenyl-3-methyl-5-hydroxy-6-metoxy-1,4-benzoquinol methylase
MNQVLLIGNGPSAVRGQLGKAIDDFDGPVVRFNYFKRVPASTGTRTDVWAAVISSKIDQEVIDHLDHVLFVHPHPSTMIDSNHEYYASLVNNPFLSNTQIKSVHDEAATRAVALLGLPRPVFNGLPVDVSSGAMVAMHYIMAGYKVWLHGFDFMCGHRHHWADNLSRGNIHQPEVELAVFQEMMRSHGVRILGHDLSSVSLPPFNEPLPCGTGRTSNGREPCQAGWYDMVGQHVGGKTVLDVGCGMCRGMQQMREAGASHVSGIDIDPNILRLGDDGVLIGDVIAIPSKSFDVVTCIECIEHVVEDRRLLWQMRRIAREAVYVTSPNFRRSRSRNLLHAREYTIAWMINDLRPRALAVASPDGKIHRTVLFGQIGDMSGEPMPSRVPYITRYDDTVDEECWPHMLAVFDPLE